MAFEFLTARTAVLALQSGEPGPFAQAIAGVDIALWDLQARRAQQPLWRLLGGASPRVRVYASGLNPERPAELAATRRNEGFRAFKLKIGFGKERDLANVARGAQRIGRRRRSDGRREPGMVARHGARHGRARSSRSTSAGWKSRCAPIGRGPNGGVARSHQRSAGGGRKSRRRRDFRRCTCRKRAEGRSARPREMGWLHQGVPLARRILAAGARFCPHWLGGGIGLLASAHALAAVRWRRHARSRRQSESRFARQPAARSRA